MDESDTTEDAAAPSQKPAPRTELSCAAWIDCCDGSPTLSCTVINLSRTGAKIAVRVTRPLPETFVLRFTANATIAVIAKQIWQRGSAIGVQFLDRVDGPPGAEDASDRLRAKFRLI